MQTAGADEENLELNEFSLYCRSQHLPVTFLKAEYYEAIKYLKSQRTMGKESDLLHAVKNGEVSYVRKALQKFRSNNRNSKFDCYFINFFICKIKIPWMMLVN